MFSFHAKVDETVNSLQSLDMIGYSPSLQRRPSSLRLYLSAPKEEPDIENLEPEREVMIQPSAVYTCQQPHETVL